MPRRSHDSTEKSQPRALRVDREGARIQLQRRFALGRELLDAIKSRISLDEAERQKKKWTDYNVQLLETLFTDDSVVSDYHSSGPSYVLPYPRSPGDELQFLLDCVQGELTQLESILDRLDLFQEVGSTRTRKGPRSRSSSVDERSVFIVHGHDDAAREKVARFVGRVGLEPVILHELNNRGRTLIEKFEEAAAVPYAIAILTPDDECSASTDRSEPEHRARQNVVFELGYFFGRLGRGQVAALYAPEVTLPSDIQGLAYIPFDDGDAWQLKLARELKEAGLPIDPEALLS